MRLLCMVIESGAHSLRRGTRQLLGLMAAAWLNRGTRRNLPHWQQGEKWVFVTWRLSDSLPKAMLEQWKEERTTWLALHPEPWDEQTESEYHDRFSRQIDEWLDQGAGACVLKDTANARIVA